MLDQNRKKFLNDSFKTKDGSTHEEVQFLFVIRHAEILRYKANQLSFNERGIAFNIPIDPLRPDIIPPFCLDFKNLWAQEYNAKKNLLELLTKELDVVNSKQKELTEKVSRLEDEISPKIQRSLFDKPAEKIGNIRI